eukprot:SAG22_NODE_725_length_7622_cov_1.958926_2_plen_196_part_00
MFVFLSGRTITLAHVVDHWKWKGAETIQTSLERELAGTNRRRNEMLINEFIGETLEKARPQYMNYIEPKLRNHDVFQLVLTDRREAKVRSDPLVQQSSIQFGTALPFCCGFTADYHVLNGTTLCAVLRHTTLPAYGVLKQCTCVAVCRVSCLWTHCCTLHRCGTGSGSSAVWSGSSCRGSGSSCSGRLSSPWRSF